MYKKVDRILAEVDPMQFFPEAPPDEYSPEVQNLLPLLRACHSVVDVEKALADVFSRMFSQDVASAIRQEFAVMAAQIYDVVVELKWNGTDRSG